MQVYRTNFFREIENKVPMPRRITLTRAGQLESLNVTNH